MSKINLADYSGDELKKKLDERLAQTDSLVNEIKTMLNEEGILYDSSKWVTIAEYCKRHGINKTQTVSMWIKRGAVPPSDIRDFPELGNLRLIRDKEYLQARQPQ